MKNYGFEGLLSDFCQRSVREVSELGFILREFCFIGEVSGAGIPSWDPPQEELKRIGGGVGAFSLLLYIYVYIYCYTSIDSPPPMHTHRLHSPLRTQLSQCFVFLNRPCPKHIIKKCQLNLFSNLIENLL